MAIYDKSAFERQLARELAALYGGDYEALKADLSKEPDREGMNKAACLSIVLNAFSSRGMETDAVFTILGWTADGIPKGERRFTGFTNGYEEGLAENLAGLYDDFMDLKKDLAKARMVGSADAQNHPKERGVCLNIVLKSLEQSAIYKYRVVKRELERIADMKRE